MSNSPFVNRLLATPEVRGAWFSPDGQWLAFNWVRRHENTDVFLVPADGSSTPLALTHTPEATTFVNWSPDSNAVLVSQDKDGDEFAQIFRVAVDTPLRMELLSGDNPGYFPRGGSLIDNGRTLVFGANFDFAGEDVIEDTWIYSRDLATGAIRLLANPAGSHSRSIRVNAQGTLALYDSDARHPGGVQVHLLDLSTGADTEWLNFGDRRKCYAWWLPDGEQVVIMTESKDGQPQQHQSIGIAPAGSSEIRWLVDDPQRQIDSLTVTPDGTVVLYEVVQARLSSTLLNPHTGIETPVLVDRGNMMVHGQAVDGGWVGTYYASTQPRDLVRFDLNEGRVSNMRSLTGLWSLTALTAEDLSPAEAFSWDSVDGVRIHGWLYRAQPNPMRAILFIHGGPTSHSEDAINPQIQSFVKAGFNVLDVNYRGSTGHGLAFRESIKEDGWGGREQADIAAGAQALIDSGLAEPGRVGVTGTSYGGYSSWCQITQTPTSVIAAAVPICGMTDLVIDYDTTRPDLRPYSAAMMGGTPAELPEKYRQRSPINHIEGMHGKLLIVQGARDPNVTPQHVEDVEVVLHQYEKDYGLMIFDDEGHGIGKPKNQVILIARMIEFFDEALK